MKLNRKELEKRIKKLAKQIDKYEMEKQKLDDKIEDAVWDYQQAKRDLVKAKALENNNDIYCEYTWNKIGKNEKFYIYKGKVYSSKCVSRHYFEDCFTGEEFYGYKIKGTGREGINEKNVIECKNIDDLRNKISRNDFDIDEIPSDLLDEEY